MSYTVTRRHKTIAGVAGLLMLAVPLAACGSSSSSSSSSEVQPAAEVDNLATHGGMTEVLLAKSFVGALGSLGLTPGTFEKAKLTKSSPNGTLQFPITGGWVELYKPGSVKQFVVGQLQHEGSGFTLTKGSTVVTIGNFNVDPGRSVVYGDVALNGAVQVTSTPIFDLHGSTLQLPITPTAKDVVLNGSGITVDPGAAKLLDSVFKTTAITGSTVVGTARVTVNLK